MQSAPNGSAPPSTARALEAITFAGAAREWLDHGIGGNVDLGEALDAASILIDRATSLAKAA